MENNNNKKLKDLTEERIDYILDEFIEELKLGEIKGGDVQCD